jgi:hypothetical protein
MHWDRQLAANSEDANDLLARLDELQGVVLNVSPEFWNTSAFRFL